MIKKIYITLISLILCMCNAYAIDITTEAGELATHIGTQTDASALTVSGTIDVRDLKFIVDEMINLSTLDLSKSSIAAFSGKTPYFGSKYSYKANEIPNLCFFGKEYSSIALPNNLISIDEGAFTGCKAISNIILPSTLSSIGNYAFYDCDNISAISLPSSVQNIGQYAFAKCDKLTTVTQSNSTSDVTIGNYAFWNLPLLSNVSLAPKTASIGASTFSDCPALKSFKFPDYLAIIGEEAFKGTNISIIELSKNIKLTTIGRYAFADNSSVTSVKLPNNLQSLGEGAFFYNTSLNSIEIPTSITTINDFLFTGCASMTNDKIINDDVTTIGQYAFSDWKSLAALLIPSTVTSIGDYAMENCTELKSISTKAVAPPALGENVFNGIAQKNIILYAPYTGLNSYKNASQWKEFDIRIDPLSSQLNENNAKDIKAFFDASLLHIQTGCNMAQVHLYDINGVELAFVTPESTSTTIDTTGFNGNIYIVTVKTINNTTYKLKLIRK